MKIWKLSKSECGHTILVTLEKVYSDPLDASREMFEQYTTRFNLHNKDVLIAEYHPAICANLVLKDGRRWTWAIDMLEIA